MRRMTLPIKILTIALTVFIVAMSAPTTKSYAQATISPTCNPVILQGMKDRAAAVAQRNSQIAQSTITRPDAAANMVCLGEQLLAAALAIGKIFSDNPQFKGSCSIGSMSGDTIDAIANTMVFVVSAYNLGGGTLNINRDTVTNMLTMYAANTYSGAIGAALTSFLGGGCWAGLAGNLVSSAISNIFGGNLCDVMDQVWSGVALKNTKPDMFKTLRELQTAANDPRQSAGAGGTPLPFTHALATTLFADAIDVDAADLVANGAFASVNIEYEKWGPYSKTGQCHAQPMFGPFISCNPGCKVSGSYPTWTCVP